MFCGKCGNKLNSDDIWCGKCGAKVLEERPPYSNPYIKSINSDSHGFGNWLNRTLYTFSIANVFTKVCVIGFLVLVVFLCIFIPMCTATDLQGTYKKSGKTDFYFKSVTFKTDGTGTALADTGCPNNTYDLSGTYTKNFDKYEMKCSSDLYTKFYVTHSGSNGLTIRTKNDAILAGDNKVAAFSK